MEVDRLGSGVWVSASFQFFTLTAGECHRWAEKLSGGTLGWRGGLVVGRRTCDLVVAGSRPGRDAAA